MTDFRDRIACFLRLACDDLASLATPVHARPGRLLVVKADGIGDFILFLDTFKEYRRLFPKDTWEITLLGNENWADLADGLPFADRYLFIDVKRFIFDYPYRFRAIRDIRTYGFTVSINPTFSRRFLIEDSIVRACGAVERIGSAGDMSNMLPWQKTRSDRWFTRLIPASAQPLTELERNAEFLRGLGLTDFTPGLPPLQVSERKFSPVPEPYVVLAPGGNNPSRRWPAERFAETARTMYDRYGLTPVIVGGPSDGSLAETIVGHAPSLPWVNRAGVSLSETVHLISHAGLAIANDTGAAHIAAALRRPTVCVAGGGHWNRFVPYPADIGDTMIVSRRPMECAPCNWRCKYSVSEGEPYPCVVKVTVEQVLDSIRSLLDHRADDRTAEGDPFPSTKGDTETWLAPDPSGNEDTGREG
jgi:ADP-heptose:LPS heptosyltransferase